MGINCSVKDTRNLYSANVWSGGEVSNDLNSSEYSKGNGIVFEISSFWSTNGNKSIKCITSGEYIPSSWIRFPVSISEDDIGKSITFKAKIYSFSQCKSHLLLNDTVNTSVTVPVSDNAQGTNIELTTTITEGTDSVKLNIGAIDASTPVNFYIDSLECYM